MARWKNRTPQFQDRELDVLKDIRDLLLITVSALTDFDELSRTETRSSFLEFLRQRRETEES